MKKQCPEVPARLAQLKPSKAMLSLIRQWMSVIPPDTMAAGISEERRLELRCGLVINLAYSSFCSTPGKQYYKGSTVLTKKQCEEVNRLYLDMTFGPERNNPQLSFWPLSDIETMYDELIQAEARAHGLWKGISTRRREGSNAMKIKGEKKAQLFRSEFKRLESEIRNDPHTDKGRHSWSKKARIAETIKRMKKREIIIKARTAYEYLRPKSCTAKA